MPVPVQKFREIVFQLLYSYDLGRASEENMLELISKELAVSNKTVKEAQQRVQDIRKHLEEIDKMIANTSRSYAFERIQSVEKNILRLGTYEIFFDESIPFKVAISEAMRLARKFSTKESAIFVNAILDALHKASLGAPVDHDKLEKSSEELNQSEAIAHEASQNQPKEQTDDN